MLLLCVRFSFSTPSQEICLRKRLRNDLFCVELDVKPQLNQSTRTSCAILSILGWYSFPTLLSIDHAKLVTG